MTSLIYRGGDGPVLGPTMTIDPMGNHAAVDAKFSGPIGDAHGLTVGGDHPRASFVSGLVRSRRPFAVARFVMTVAVDALQRKARRTLTHVRKKLGWPVKPFGANLDSTSAVVRELLVLWIGAAGFHVKPSIIFLRASHTMRKIGFGCPFFLQAAAGLDAAIPQMASTNNLGVSAVADAIPVMNGAALLGVPNDGQSSDAQAGPVDKFHTFHLVLLTVKDACQATVKSLFGSYPRHASALYREVLCG